MPRRLEGEKNETAEWRNSVIECMLYIPRLAPMRPRGSKPASERERRANIEGLNFGDAHGSIGPVTLRFSDVSRLSPRRASHSQRLATHRTRESQ